LADRGIRGSFLNLVDAPLTCIAQSLSCGSQEQMGKTD
jgi:hypothetical protein